MSAKQPQPMENGTSIDLEFTDLKETSRSGLQKMWQRAFNTPLPLGFSRDLVIRRLAYHLQEQAFGGLGAPHRRRLATLSKQLAEGNGAAFETEPLLKPGSRLIREWRGQTYQVTVLEDGFNYEGKRYGSLSKIAREITGTRWSGPRFFGLKKTVTVHGQ